MKYIRTKDGRIIKIGEQTDVGYEKGIFEVHNKAGIVVSYEPIEVLKETNTIEELCDEFIGVMENGNGAHIWYDDEYLSITGWETTEELSKLKYEYAKANLSLNQILYGAIWTDKGLTYVAKLNKKGQWELL